MTRIPFFLYTLLLTLPALAQTPQRIDFTSLVNRMPKLPASTQEALSGNQQNNPYLPYADEVRTWEEKIKQLNPISLRAQNKAVALDAKFKADGVDKMTDSQKIDYAKQQNLGGAGSNARIDFAQQMKDPAFQKKFQAMSPQEKVAYMQQQGVMQTPATMPQSSNPMQAEMMAIMQDPAMREKWKNMSASERQAFIEERKKAKGHDASRRPTTAPTQDSGGSFADILDDKTTTAKPATSALPVTMALAKSKAFQEAITAVNTTIQALVNRQKQQTEQAKSNLQKAIREAGEKQVNEGIAEAKRQGKSGKNWVLTNPAVDRQIRITACQQRQRADNTILAETVSTWANQQAALKKAASDYQAAMEAIRYGETLVADDSQFQKMALLSGQQQAVLSMLSNIDEAFNQLASQTAQTQFNLLDESKLIAGPRELLMVGEG